MNNHTQMPTIAFEEGTDYDTLDSLMAGWCAQIRLANGDTFTAKWVGTDNANNAQLLAWSNTDEAYTAPATVPIDDIVHLSIV